MFSKIQLNLTSSNKESLFLYKNLLVKIFQKLNFKYTCFSLPLKTYRLTLNKSPHVNKTAREQFELKKYKISFQVLNFMENETLKYIFLNKPKTIKIQIKKLLK